MSDYIVNLLPLQGDERAEFEAIAPDATHIYAGRRTVTPEQLAAATVVLGWPRPRDMAQCVNLKWFQTMWAGTDEYDTPGILPEGIMMTSSSGSNRLSVAEHMLAMLMALCRRLPTYRDSQREHKWEDEGAMKTIFGGTVLVAGAGNIGSTFAGMCKALGARTIGLKRTVTGPVAGFDELYPMEKLDELLPEADVVALVVPHSPATEGLMNRERIALLKDAAVLISCGRGSVLDQDALVDAMNAGRLWGASMDVTTPEPLPADSPLWDIPNLIITPHCAGNMALAYTCDKVVDMFLTDLAHYAKGEKLTYLVNRKVGY